MYDAFQAAGPHWQDTPEMDRISSHKSVVYLISEGGSIEAAHAIMEAANGLLKSGGFAVKVESTGLAHPPDDWNEQCEYNYLFLGYIGKSFFEQGKRNGKTDRSNYPTYKMW